jgi:UDP-N-acetylmuramate--alanine ligase
MRPFVQRLHFCGIGGAGMSGLAEVLHRQGLHVTGSDLARNPATSRLQALGIPVALGHAAEHLGAAQVMVVSTAVPEDNPELLAARQRGIPVVHRGRLLAELMRPLHGIAVAGAHGKTTTTALLASVLVEAGLDPTAIVGGDWLPGGGHARLGQGAFLVAEADESDASFLHLHPTLAVVTNIDADHMDTYGHDLARLQDAFVEFLQALPFYGAALLCTDDPGVRAILPRLSVPVLGYGLGPDAALRAVDLQAQPGGGMRFTALRPGAAPLAVRLSLSGAHNVANALATIGIAQRLGVADSAVQRALSGFGGVGRRFQHHGELHTADGGRCLVIDDYGHHPAELAAVLSAARAAYPGRRLVAAFQPHRYTRTRDHLQGFAQVLAGFDAVALAPVYAAGEQPIEGADSAALAAAMQAAGARSPLRADSLALTADALSQSLHDGDLLLTLGAGSIGELPALLRQRMNQGVSP